MLGWKISVWFSEIISVNKCNVLFVGMYKNQLQELAQRSCFNLPSYSCIREGPDHAPRFKATVNFNGETFESPTFCSTLRQAEHAAAEVALSTLANRGPSKALAARVLVSIKLKFYPLSKYSYIDAILRQIILSSCAFLVLGTGFYCCQRQNR